MSNITEDKLKIFSEMLLDHQKAIKNIEEESDKFFLIVIAIVIFFMQCGFAFLEAGSVHSKNTVNILMKNLLDVFLGGVSYWAIGWGLAYGDNGNQFCGGNHFFNFKLDYSAYPKWFFQFVFAATAATIVSGAVAERCQFLAYFTYSILITGWVYPVVSHWAWDPSGWLAQTGLYMDFAGSGVVHLLGACCSLVGCYFLGPRLHRFSEDGKPNDMAGHSIPLIGLGGFILLFGFLAFNGGSQGSISQPGDGDVVALAIVNTILGASTGGLMVLFINKFMFKQIWSFTLTLNGSLAGMVALCAGCNIYEPWAALIVGAIGGLGFMVFHSLMLRLQLDDPLDAVAVHGAGGLIGLLSVPWFMFSGLEVGSRGIFWDGHLAHPWLVLAYQIAGALAIAGWAVFWSTLMFGLMHVCRVLRVSSNVEMNGIDVLKHGESAYPANAWLDVSTCMHASGVFSGIKTRKLSNKESQLHLIDEAPAVKMTTFDIESTKDKPEEVKDRLGSSVASEISNEEDNTIQNGKVQSEKLERDNKSFETEES